jgi:hypothetical protein
MAFMDISPIINVVKAATPPPHQAQPSVAETMKPVPDTDIQAPVPPPAKGAQPGLGERFDHYDTEHPRTEHAKTAPGPAESKAQQVIPEDAPTREVQAAIVRAQVEKADRADRAGKSDKTAKAAQAAQARQVESEDKEKAKVDAELLGNDTGLPQPSVEPVHLDLPFLKPLGMPPPLGRSIDARI